MKKLWVILVVILAFVAGILLGYRLGSVGRPYGVVGVEEQNALYFPTIINQQFPTIGVQVDGSWVFQELIIPNRIYQSPAHWTDIESIPGAYNFPSWLDRNVEWFGDNPIIIGTRTTPVWARLWPEFQGSPPKDDFYSDYARFLIAICNRYDPWGIEMFNEPDIGTEDISNATQYYYGAWVLDEDYYSAGFRYGRMTVVVYPLVKEACPGVQLISGALAGNDIQSTWFLRGMLDAGLKTDYISFHRYIHNEDEFDSIFTFSKLLREYTSIPQIVSETNLISSTGGSAHEALKTLYIKYLKANIKNSSRYDSGVDFVLIYGMCNTWFHASLALDCQPSAAWKEWAK